MNRVLVIEDDQAVASLVKRMCEEANIKPHEFTIINSLDSGIKNALEKPVDLIILDLVIPPRTEQDGINAIAALSPIAPVGVFTGSTSPAVSIECHRMGAHFCFFKQRLLSEKCAIERLGQAISDAALNWRREYAAKV